MSRPNVAQIERSRRFLKHEGAYATDLQGCATAAASRHSRDLREHEITPDGGIVVGQPLKGYKGVVEGTPATRWERQRS